MIPNPVPGTPDRAASNWAARFLAAIYARLPQRLTAFARRGMTRLEGGEMRSASLRTTMLRHHGVEVGMHSYGCFDPTRFSHCKIGRYVSIGPGVRTFRRNHPTDRISLHPYFYNTQLGHTDAETLPPMRLEISDDVWIGANALLLPGCRRIGRGAVIGAGAVVTRDIPDFAIAAGNPARVIRNRFPADVQKLVQESGWWRMDRESLLTTLSVLQQPATAEIATTFKKRICDAQ
jgi:virginiamycin A acetyltransferase